VLQLAHLGGESIDPFDQIAADHGDLRGRDGVLGGFLLGELLDEPRGEGCCDNSDER